MFWTHKIIIKGCIGLFFELLYGHLDVITV